MQSIYLLIKEKAVVGYKSVLFLMFFSHSFSFLCALMHFSENDDIHHEFIAFNFVHVQNLLGCKVNFSIMFKKLLFSNLKLYFLLQGAFW